jgi:hypothetical protein
MQLRSGRVLQQTDMELNEAAHTLMEFYSQVHFDYINKKIESAPRELRDTCRTCLKEIITESLKKGINIKFEKQ